MPSRNRPYHCFNPVRAGLITLCLAAAAFYFRDSAHAQGTTTGEVGQEIRDLEKKALEVKPVAPGKKTKVKLEKPKGEKGDKAGREKDQLALPELIRLVVKGDSAILEDAGVRAQLVRKLSASDLSENVVKETIAETRKQLINAGYYLANMSLDSLDKDKREVVVIIDQGRFGKISLLDDKKEPYTGKHFSEKLLRKKMDRLEEGEVFNYNEFYRTVLMINTHPDLTVDVDLAIKTITEQGLSYRYADMAFSVHEDLPFHAVLEVNNTGTESTEEWRFAAGLQHLNITGHDDSLTLSLPVSVDLEAIRSASLSYNLPLRLWKGGSFTLYGGYSDLDVDELDEAVGIGVEGEGVFAGAQFGFNLLSTANHNVSGSLGLTYSRVEDGLLLDGVGVLPREVTVAPLTIGLSYASVKPDALGGKTFISSYTSINIGEQLGGSDDAEIAQSREGAEADYIVERIHLARMQPLFASDAASANGSSYWNLFLRVDGQIGSGDLIPGEKKTIGGAGTVRGYATRNASGDAGVSGTLELRTPVYAGLVSSVFGLKEGEPDNSPDRLQLIAFVDGGYVETETPLTGEESDETLSSAGLGVRFAFTRYFQFQADYGVPFEDSENSDSSGYVHINAKAMF